MRLLILFLASIFICSSLAAQQITLKNYNETDTLNWQIPFAQVENEVFDFRHFPDETKNFTLGLGSFFNSDVSGRINSYRFYIDKIEAERPDSSVNRYSRESELKWKFGQKAETESFEKFAQLIQAPYVGTLESVSINVNKVFAADGNDSLLVRFHPPLLSVTQTESYFNSGIVWFFGLPRTTNNVSQYGVRFTAPGDEGTVKLQAVDFYIFSINDTRFYSNYDTPANDSLIVRVYKLSESGFPTDVLAEKVYGFSDLSAGFDNRFDFSDSNLQFNAGESYVVATEVKRVDNQDFIGLVSGTSFDVPLNRTIMFENDGWIYLSESASWGSGGAKGAEIRATAVYEDPNNKTPDSSTNLTPYIAIAFNQINENGPTILPLKEPLSLFEGEEIWLSLEQKKRVFADSLAIFSDTMSTDGQTNTTAFYGTKLGVRSWYFSINSPTVHKNINFDISANFTAVLNDRLVFEFYNSENKTPLDFLYGTSISFNKLTENAWNELNLLDANLFVDAGSELFASMETFKIQYSDGISLRTDKGDSERKDSQIWAKESFESETAWNKHWLPFQTETKPALWAELRVNVNTTSTEFSENEIPNKSELLGAYPNPFNPSTTIRFRLANQEKVQFTVFDMLGRLVSQKELGNLISGEHQISFEASNLSSGIYFYQVRLNAQILSGKMTLLK
jgi:hypothetical protein